MDIVKYRIKFLDQLKPMDHDARRVVNLIQNDMPEIWNNLSIQSAECDHIQMKHPVERLLEYRILAGKLAVDIQQAETVLAAIKALSNSVSMQSGELIKKKFWNPGDAEDEEGVIS